MTKRRLANWFLLIPLYISFFLFVFPSHVAADYCLNDVITCSATGGSGGSPGIWICCCTCCDDAGGCVQDCCAAPAGSDSCTPCVGCFTGETTIDTESQDTGVQGEKEIKDLQPGEIVSSFNPETGEISEGEVSDIKKTTREGYYILETESGKKVKVTAEHPFLAVKAENDQISNSKLQTISKFQNSISKLGDFLSHTLTYQLVSNLATKITAAFE